MSAAAAVLALAALALAGGAAAEPCLTPFCEVFTPGSCACRQCLPGYLLDAASGTVSARGKGIRGKGALGATSAGHHGSVCTPAPAQAVPAPALTRPAAAVQARLPAQRGRLRRVPDSSAQRKP